MTRVISVLLTVPVRAPHASVSLGITSRAARAHVTRYLQEYVRQARRVTRPSATARASAGHATVYPGTTTV